MKAEQREPWAKRIIGLMIVLLAAVPIADAFVLQFGFPFLPTYITSFVGLIIFLVVFMT